MASDKTLTKTKSDSPFNRTAQHSAKRQAILSQAAMLFNSKGSRATTLTDIAMSLGLTKTSLYYYVKTKDELVYQAYLAAIAHHNASLDTIEAEQSQPLDRISAFILKHFRDWMAAREGQAPHIAALMEIASLKGTYRSDVEAAYIAMFKRIREYVREGIAQGSIRQCEATATTRAIIGSVEWIFHWLHDHSPTQVEMAAQATLDILLNGLYAGAGDYPIAGFHYQSGSEKTLPGFDKAAQNRLKQEAFYKTGTRFFNKQGFAGTSLDEIAEQLHVSKGAFYYHIKNKEDLLYSCYNRSLDISEEIYAQASQATGNGLQKVEQTFRHSFYLQNCEDGPLIRYYTITSLAAERRRKVLKRTNALNHRFGEFIEEGIQDGSIRPIDPRVARNLSAGATNAAMEIGLWRKVDDIDSTAVDYFCVFFNGLKPRN